MTSGSSPASLTTPAVAEPSPASPWWRGRRPGAARAARSPRPDREIPRSKARYRRPWRPRRRRCRWSSHSGAGPSFGAMPLAIVRLRGAVTAGDAAHDRAGPDRRRPALGRRQDHGDAGAAGGAPAPRARRAGGQGRVPTISTPRFHEAATGRPSFNLDSWAMPPALLDALVREAAAQADLLVIEGAMGLFDGIPAASAPDRGVGRPRRAALICRCCWSSMSPGNRNRRRRCCAGSPRTIRRSDRRRGAEPGRQRAARQAGGRGPRARSIFPSSARSRATQTLALPERHLGLVQASEHGDLAVRLAQLADMAERHLDLDGDPALGRAASPVGSASVPCCRRRGSASRWRRTRRSASSIRMCWTAGVGPGPRSSPFSPLADEAPPEHCDSCWLPGRLSRASRRAARRRRALSAQGWRSFAATRPVHGECGGYMVLGESLEDADGVSHRMAGLLGHATSFAQAQASSRLSPGAAARRRPAWARRARACAGMSSTMRR